MKKYKNFLLEDRINPDTLYSSGRDITLILLRNVTKSTYELLFNGDQGLSSAHPTLLRKFIVREVKAYRESENFKQVTYDYHDEYQIELLYRYGNYQGLEYLSCWSEIRDTIKYDTPNNFINKVSYKNLYTGYKLFKIIFPEKLIEIITVGNGIEFSEKMFNFIKKNKLYQQIMQDKYVYEEVRISEENDIWDLLGKEETEDTQKILALRKELALLKRDYHLATPSQTPAKILEINRLINKLRNEYNIDMEDFNPRSIPLNILPTKAKLNLSTPTGQLKWQYKLGEDVKQ